MIARWPWKIPPGSATDQTFCLTDIMATVAAVVGFELPNAAAEDSYNFQPVLTGEQGGSPVRARQTCFKPAPADLGSA